MSDKNLFSAADEILSPFLQQINFDQSLVFNILFQEQLLLHEAYYFASTFLAKHIINSSHYTSLFEVATRNGLIVPAFRDKNVSTLEASYNRMLEIYGKETEFYNVKYFPAAVYRLYDATEKGSLNTEPFFWPENMSLGEDYYEIVKQYLSQDTLPDYIIPGSERHLSLNKYWDATKRWRMEFVDKAAENTRKRGSKGLQRGELFKLIGHDIGVPASINSIGLNEITQHSKDKAKLKAAEVFIKWLSQCHHIGLARNFKSALNFPVYQLNEDFLGESIARTVKDEPLNSLEGFNCEVSLPPMDVFLKDNPENLISIRKELGSAYLTALKNWQLNPTIENQERTKVLFEDYCSRICKWYKTYPPVKLMAAYDRGNNIGKKGLDLAKSVASAVIPLSGIFVAVGNLGHSIYQYFASKKSSTPRKQMFEISVHENPENKA